MPIDAPAFEPMCAESWLVSGAPDWCLHRSPTSIQIQSRATCGNRLRHVDRCVHLAESVILLAWPPLISMVTGLDSWFALDGIRSPFDDVPPGWHVAEHELVAGVDVRGASPRSNDVAALGRDFDDVIFGAVCAGEIDGDEDSVPISTL